MELENDSRQQAVSSWRREWSNERVLPAAYFLAIVHEERLSVMMKSAH